MTQFTGCSRIKDKLASLNYFFFNKDFKIPTKSGKITVNYMDFLKNLSWFAEHISRCAERIKSRGSRGISKTKKQQIKRTKTIRGAEMKKRDGNVTMREPSTAAERTVINAVRHKPYKNNYIYTSFPWITKSERVSSSVPPLRSNNTTFLLVTL